MAKQLTKKISFPEYDKDLFDFLDNCNNASALVRRLLRAYISGVNINNNNPIIASQENITSNNEDESKIEKINSTKKVVTNSSEIFEKANPINEDSILALQSLEGI